MPYLSGLIGRLISPKQRNWLMLLLLIILFCVGMIVWMHFEGGLDIVYDAKIRAEHKREARELEKYMEERHQDAPFMWEREMKKSIPIARRCGKRKHKISYP